MTYQMTPDARKRINVLSLDGGGVRGLSSLIILRELLCRVNRRLNPKTHNGKPIHPSKVFDLIVGTSTGGLIALMLVKLNMDVDECIEQYKTLSKEIFKQWHIFGKASGGFGHVKKYSSKNLRKVLLENVIQPSLERQGLVAEAADYMMEEIKSHPRFMCSVVCREIDSRDSRRGAQTVFLCTHWETTVSAHASLCNACCRKKLNRDRVPVIDAARATSAAPTYFKSVRILDTELVDGGFGETNNPSQAAYLHYFLNIAQEDSEYDAVQMVNIGTGTRDPDSNPRKTFIDRIPLVRGMARIAKDLAALATESERVGETMHVIEQNSPAGLLRFQRFSANKGDIHQIKLYKYKRVDKLKKITEQYLKDTDIDTRLEILADQLAETCQQRLKLGVRSIPMMEQDVSLTVLQYQDNGSGSEVSTHRSDEREDEEDEDASSISESEGHLRIYHTSVLSGNPGLTDASSLNSHVQPPTRTSTTELPSLEEQARDLESLASLTHQHDEQDPTSSTTYLTEGSLSLEEMHRTSTEQSDVRKLGRGSSTPTILTAA